MLFITRILIENVSQAMILPTATFTGSSLLMICRSKGSIYWLYLILGAIICICFCLFYSCEMILITRCVIVNPSPMSSFNSTYYIETLVINSVVIIATYLFQSFASWTDDIVPVLHLIATIIILIPKFPCSLLDVRVKSKLKNK